MIVGFKESVSIDPADKPIVFAYAGFLGLFKRGMTFRDCVKAVMAARGTNWVGELETVYPPSPDYPPKAQAKRRVTKAKSPDNNVAPTAAKPVVQPSPVKSSK